MPTQPPDPTPAEGGTGVFGQRYNPFAEHLEDPYPFYRQAQQHPVFFAPLLNAWVLTRYPDVRYALAHPEIFSSANALRPLTPLHPETLDVLATGYPRTPEPITTDGPAHRRLRTPLVRALSPARIQALTPHIRQAATELLDAMLASGDRQADLMAAYAYPLPVQVLGALFGIDPDDLDQVARGSYDSVRVVASTRPPAEQAAAAHGMLALQELCGTYARRRRTAPGEDLISTVVADLAPGDDPLTPEQEAEIAQVVHGVLIAGHVTTSAAIGSGLRHLLTHHDQWQRLCDQPTLIPRAVEEILRHDTPVQGFLRLTTRPVTLGEVTLPAGAEVLLLYGAANHDPTRFPDPDQLDITRPPIPSHLAFGTGGPHHCAGAGLARAELTITLQLLTRHVPELRLATGETVDIEPTLTTRGPTTLPVAW